LAFYRQLRREKMAAYGAPGRRGGRGYITPADVDISEIMKGVMFDKNSCGSPTPNGLNDQYAVFDTAVVDYPAALEQGLYRFNIVTESVTSDQRVGVLTTLSNVIQIETYPFFVGVPPIVAVDAGSIAGVIGLVPNTGPTDPRTADPVTGVSSQLDYASRVTLYLTNIGVQSFTDRSGRRHHFEYTATEVGDPNGPGAKMLLTPVQSVYTFTQPISDISHLTFQFNTPDGPLVLPTDQIRGVTLSTNGAGSLIVTTPIRLPGGGVVDLTTLLFPGDRIYLVGVNISGVLNDAEISNYLSKPAGLFVGIGITANTLDLDPNVSLPTVGPNVGMISNTPITLWIAKNRFRAPLRFRTLCPKITNSILPV
jgi:hypothetical protein